MPTITIVNKNRKKMLLETNTHLEIRGPNPPMERAGGVEGISPDDEVVIDTGREVRIELRGDSLSVLVL